MIVFDIHGSGGHAQIAFDFDKNMATIDWKKASLQERATLQKTVRNAVANGYIAKVNGKAMKDVPDDMFDKNGSVLLTKEGEGNLLKIVAKGLIEAEASKGKIFTRLNDDGTWEVVGAKDFDLEGDNGKKDQRIETHSTISGG